MTLNTADLIFGKNYAGGGVDYTLRAPSVGSSYTGSGDSERGTPKSNEWDKILDKDDGYIKNWKEMLFVWTRYYYKNFGVVPCGSRVEPFGPLLDQLQYLVFFFLPDLRLPPRP